MVTIQIRNRKGIISERIDHKCGLIEMAGPALAQLPVNQKGYESDITIREGAIEYRFRDPANTILSLRVIR